MRTLLLLLFFNCSVLSAQRQYADTLYVPPAFDANYTESNAPLVLVDASHYNMHTHDGRYRPFANVLRKDGFRVEGIRDTMTLEKLKEADILVISNALPETSLNEWKAPTASAFSEPTIRMIHDWVKQGGRLFLIADHMPMGGAAKELAAAFGFTFHDSFADNVNTKAGPEIFSRKKGTLEPSIITNGEAGYFKVNKVASFTGQAFEIPVAATSILNCGEGWVSSYPEVAWQFSDETPVRSSAGWSQGAFMPYGKGKVVMFGEAAMFSAQVIEIDNRRILAGMNQKRVAGENYRLLLNVMRWLAQE